MWHSVFLLSVFVIVGWANTARASVLPPELGDVTVGDLREAAIAFINVSTGPGLEGASQEVKQEQRNTVFERASLGFAADFGLPRLPFDGYWGGAIIDGSLSESMYSEGIFDSAPLRVDVERHIQALRGSFGLSYPVTNQLRLRPFMTLVLSRFNTNGIITREGGISPFGLPEDETLTEKEVDYFIANEVGALTGVGTIEATYRHWLQSYTLDWFAQYSVSYTDLDSRNGEHLNAYDWRHFAVAKVKATHSTGRTFFSRPLDWLVYANYSNYLNQPKEALGFTQIIELGVGVEWQWNVKPLNWFGLSAFGVKAGGVFGRDVRGTQLAFIIR